MTRADTIIDLAPEAAARALYIDFEGQKDQPPILLGCTRRSGADQLHMVRQVITDPVFGPLARADHLELLSLADAVLRIIQRAEKADRLIVAWTERERESSPHSPRRRRRTSSSRVLVALFGNPNFGRCVVPREQHIECRCVLIVSKRPCGTKVCQFADLVRDRGSCRVL